nr:hypothetical protein [Tanacetum cinerariifolium]
MSSKHRMLSKNSTFLNNIEVHIVSSDDENKSDEAFTIRFKRFENRKRQYIPKIPTMALIDESTDDDFVNPNNVKDRFDILLDDEADDDIYKNEGSGLGGSSGSK